MGALIEEVRRLIVSARREVVSAVSSIHATTCFEIGRRIVEQEQRGERRAAYGAAVLKTLSERLTAEFGRGFSARNLAYMRTFYQNYADRNAILQMPSAKSSAFLSLDEFNGDPNRVYLAGLSLAATAHGNLHGVTQNNGRRLPRAATVSVAWRTQGRVASEPTAPRPIPGLGTA